MRTRRRQRIPGILLAVALLGAMMISMPVSADPGATVSLSPSSKTVQPGESFTVDVIINTDTPTRGVQLGLTFDPALVQVDQVVEGGFLRNWANANGASTVMLPPPAINNSTGQVSVFSIIIMGTDGPTGSGVICTFKMTAKGGVNGRADLVLKDVLVSDPSGGAVPTTVANGHVVVGSAPTITSTPTATFAPTLSPTPTATSPATATPAATLTATPTATKETQNEPTPLPTGVVGCGPSDVNRDGVVDLLDLVSVGNHWMQRGEPGWIPQDVCRDGEINLIDVVAAGSCISGSTPPPTATVQASPTATRTPVPTFTPTGTATIAHTPTPGATHTPVPTATFTATPSRTATPAHTWTATATAMPTLTATVVLSATATATPTPTVATAEASLWVSPALKTVAPGESFTVDVRFTTQAPTRGVQLGLRFDPALVQVNRVVEGGFLKDWAEANGGSTMLLPPPMINNTTGQVSVFSIITMTTPPGGPTGSGVVCSLEMTARNGVDGDAELKLVSVLVSDPNGRDVPTQVTDGTIAVEMTPRTSTPTRTGTAQPTATPTKTPGAGTPTTTPTPTRTATAVPTASGTVIVPSPTRTPFATWTPTVTPSPTATGGANVTVKVSPSTRSVASGDSFTLEVQIDSANPVRGVQLGMTFNADLVQVNRVTEGGFLRNWAQANGAATMMMPAPIVNNTTGRVSVFSILISGAEGRGATGSGVVATFEMTARPGASGQSVINLDSVLVSDPAAQPLPVEVTNGRVNVGQTATDTATPTRTGTAVASPTLTPTPSGQQTMSPTPSPTPTVHVGGTWTPTGTATATATLVPEATVQISPSTKTVGPGESFTLDVTINTAKTIRGTQMGLAFNPAVVQVDGVDVGGFFNTWAQNNGASASLMPSPIIDNSAGTVSVFAIFMTGAEGRGPTGNGTLCTIRLTAKPAASGQSNITINSFLLSNPLGEGIGATVSGGQVVIGAASTPTPTAGLTGTPTGEAGTPTVTRTPFPTYTPTQTPTPRPANLSAKLSLTPATLNVEPGQSFTVDVSIDSNYPTRGVELSIKFDATKLQLDQVKEGGFFKTWAQANSASTNMMPAPSIDNNAGKTNVFAMFLSGAAGKGPQGTGVLCTLNLKAKAGATGQAEIKLENVKVADPDALPIPSTASGAQVTLGPPGAATGTPFSEVLATGGTPAAGGGTSGATGAGTGAGSSGAGSAGTGQGPTAQVDPVQGGESTQGGTSGGGSSEGASGGGGRDSTSGGTGGSSTGASGTGAGGRSGGQAAADGSGEYTQLGSICDLTGFLGADGVVVQDGQCDALEGKVRLLIRAGTVMLGPDGRPITGIEVRPGSGELPLPQEGELIGSAVELGPSGARFKPPLRVTLLFDPRSLPAEVKPDDLTIGYYNARANKWIEMKSSLEAEGNAVTAEIDHFSSFSILARSLPFARWWVVLGTLAAEAALGVGFLYYWRRRQEQLAEQELLEEDAEDWVEEQMEEASLDHEMTEESVVEGKVKDVTGLVEGTILGREPIPILLPPPAR